ncbi:MAG: DEAD/DEAH box helicase [Synergistaceae bacterium]|jgi:SNF2 family DNA or RNA helicase|nr:DEAD/DEAH box helicase [Synergistaceae bacterium]
MIFLHGTFLRIPSPPASTTGQGGFVLWAEEGADQASPIPSPPRHPWAYDAAKLRGILDEWRDAEPALYLPDWDLQSENESENKNKNKNLPPKRRGRKPKQPPVSSSLASSSLPSPSSSGIGRGKGNGFGIFFVGLPTFDGMPLPSSPLIAEPPVVKGKTALRLERWQAEGAFFAPRDAVLFLSSLRPLAQIGDKPLKFAPDLEFCLGLLRFAGAMTARQNFLPSVNVLPAVNPPSSPQTLAQTLAYGTALWRPVFAGLERDRCESLIRSVPGLCRAVCGPDSNTGNANGESSDNWDKAPSSRRFVMESLELLTDTLVRLTQPARSAKSAEEFAHQEWIARLLAVDPSPCAALAELEPQLREWRRPIAATADAPYRLSLQLEEPEAAPDITSLDASSGLEWRLAYYVEPLDDPTLQVGTGKIFSSKSRDKKTLELLTRGNMKPQEFAAQALGQVGKLFAPIEASLRRAAPDECLLSSGEAFRFLEQDAAPLIEAGFTVRFPAWWTAKGYRKLFGLKVSVGKGSKKLAPKGQLSLDDLLNVDWQLMLEDVPVSLQELERLAALKDTMVRVRGRWVAFSQEELKKALNFLKKAPQTATVRDVLKTSLGADGDFLPGDVKFSGESVFAQMLSTLANADANRIPTLPVPQGLAAELRPYQARGFSWLAFLGRWGLGACLADDMGLGKTLQTLTLLQSRVDEGETRPALLIAPTSVLENWRREAERFLPGLKVLVHHGAARAKSADFIAEARQNHLVATSFALLVRDHSALSRVEWSGVILDEAQNVKNYDSKQAKAARQLPSEYRVALTGTPVENHVGDLWSLMEFLNPGLLGTQTVFKRRFFDPIQRTRDPEAAARLKNVTGPFVLRRLKTDKTIIDDLPEKIVTKTFCKLKKEQATLYAAVTKETERLLTEAEGIQRKGLVLATLTRLKQICNHPAQYLGETGPVKNRSGKLERLEELAEEALDVGDRMLIFTQYSEMGEILKRHLQETLGEETLFLHGGVPKARRDAMVSRFQEESGPRLFVLSLKAGGTGLNLTQANHVVLFDRWWNPAVEQQAVDRAFRIGQKKNVQVHAFVCQGTLEERIDAMIESKREIAGMTVRSGEGWLTELSSAELKDLFELRRSALAEE